MPTSKLGMVNIKECFIDTPELHDIFGESAPFLNINISNSHFIEVVGIITK